MFSLSDYEWQDVVTAVGLALIAAYLTAEFTARLARLGLARLVGGDPAALRTPMVRRPLRIVRATVFLLVALTLVPPALKVAGVRLTYGLEAKALTQWFFYSGLRIALIATIAFVLIRLIATTVQRFESTMAQGVGVDILERAKRARTLGAVVQSALAVVIVGVAMLMVLRELNVDITPVLTAAGIGGLAVGFGAQTLVKDIISGFFLILENQVRVGDVAVINGTSGLVEAINLRTVVLRDLEGVVHIFPNGSIETLANRTREFSYYVIDVGVAYKEDTDAVVAVLRQVGADLLGDPAFQPHILEPLEVLGIDDFAESHVSVKIRIRTVPLKQWDVGRELRRRIKKAFDARGIEMPFPHRTIYLGEASKPWLVQEVSSSD